MISFVPGGDPSTLPTVATNFCAEHKSKELKYYCETCGKVICAVCRSKTHSKHKYDDIANVFVHHREEIEGKMVPLNEKFLEVSQSMSQLEAYEDENTNKELAIEKSISSVFDVVQGSLQSRKNELCDRLRALAREKQEHIAAQRSELTVIHAQVSSCLGFVKDSLRACGQQEVMLLKATLLKQVDILLEESEQLSLLDSSKELLVDFSASPQSLVESCQEFGVLSSSVGDTTSHVAPRINPTLAKLLAQRLRTPVLTLTGLKGPCGVAVRGNGDVVVAEGCADCVSVFSAAGEKLLSFGKCGSDPGEFVCPCEVVVDDDDNILVVDGTNRRIQKFTPEGKFLAAVGTSGTGVLQFIEPDGIAINPVNKRIYVVNNNTHRIQILNSDLSFCDMFGKEGSGQGYLRYPWGVACSRQGEVFVTDSGNCRVQVFTPSGQFLRAFGQKGRGEAELRWPTGVSVSADGGVVYVSDYGNHRVCVFTVEGEYLHSLGKKGKHVGEFGNTRGVMVDRHGLLYVCDTDNNRVVLY